MTGMKGLGLGFIPGRRMKEMCSGQSGGPGLTGAVQSRGPGWLLSLRFLCSLTHADPSLSCHVPPARPQQEGNGWSLKVRSKEKKKNKREGEEKKKRQQTAGRLCIVPIPPGLKESFAP